MQQLHDLYKKVLETGSYSEDRTGTGTIKLIGQQMRFNLQDGFPATTTKRLAWKAMSSELLWFLEGSQDERRLCEILHGTRDPEKRTIWTDNFENQGRALGYIDGNLGPVYGKQWREWEDVIILPGIYNEVTRHTDMGYSLVERTISGMYVMKRVIDQIEVLIDGLKNDPYGRRHILSAWNVGELDKMALPPCHSFSQFFVVDGKLSCTLYQRSSDLFLGVPFNIASYSLLTHMLAQVCDLEVGEFVWMGGDCHIYQNHVEQVKEQLSRTPKELPTLWMDKSITDIDSFTMSSFKLENYNPDAIIKAPMAV
ncbi:thymidylate synthase [Salmonella phage SE_PL]|uniref:thymidylate synthase n=1 Tax=Salmonella enterica TaxID=28901 RepID=UPI000FDF8A68|nr:thymidylate synthase [Salmonella phage Munch]EAZ2023033.1 thymidylate synthase [Salmonella enterica]ECV9084169.1 thymidylate synthase [Salmonella enterica subsp. enterica serovar Infantis]QCW18938.1 thymidylate synthase [Salmonella phage 7t3]QIG62792.1 thymidylate synthase [Salmonella phage SE_PL]WNV47355.1 thymidylate synthase [Klebsiella phage fENko-Kae01]